MVAMSFELCRIAEMICQSIDLLSWMMMVMLIIRNHHVEVASMPLYIPLLHVRVDIVNHCDICSISNAFHHLQDAYFQAKEWQRK
jgi:hypothetical protein